MKRSTQDSWLNPLTVEQVDKIVRWLNSGLQPPYVAQHFGVSEQRIRRISQDDMRVQRRWPDEDEQTPVQLR